MRKFALFLAVLGFLATSNGQEITYAREIVTQLSSKEFQGRGYVNNGANKAADFMRKQFLDLKLKPFGDSYFQPFEVKTNTFPGKIRLKIDNEELVPGKDFMVDPSCSDLKGEYEIYLIKEKDLLNDDLFNKAIKLCQGKILVIDSHETGNLSTADRKKADDVIRLLRDNPRIKSIATILLTSGKLTWGVSTVQLKPFITIGNNIRMKYNSKLSITIESKMVETMTRNVIGYIEGKIQPDSFLVITAHYDHLGLMGSEVYFPGANDNASGIAMLLNLAKHFQKEVPNYSMVFVALSGEEAGLLGARYFVEYPLFDLSKTAFLVNFDIAGTGDDGIRVVNGSVYQNQFNRLRQINDEEKLLKSVQIRGKACISDHCLFDEKGVPCFYIYTLGGSTAYHDLNDTAENLTLIEFQDYFQLMVHFFSTF